MPTFGVKATPKIDSRSRFTRRRKDHDATLDGVGPRFLSRRVFLVLDGPIAAATPPASSATVTLFRGESLSVSPTSVEFGNQTVNTMSAARAVTVTNTGSTPHSRCAAESMARQANGKRSLPQMIAR